MQPFRLHNAAIQGLLPLALVAGPLLLLCAWLAGPTGLAVAAAGVFVCVAAFAASEALVLLFGLAGPLERMLLGMMIRGAVALGAAAAAVVLLDLPPKLVGGVAAPLYASLIAGEVLVAVREAKQAEAA